MALLEVKTSYAAYTDCTLRVGQYQMDGSIRWMAVSQLRSSAEERDRLQELPFACVIQL